MKKTHSKPEFSVIKIAEDNRKFFVASGTPEPSSTGGTLGSMTITGEEGWDY